MIDGGLRLLRTDSGGVVGWLDPSMRLTISRFLYNGRMPLICPTCQAAMSHTGSRRLLCMRLFSIFCQRPFRPGSDPPLDPREYALGGSPAAGRRHAGSGRRRTPGNRSTPESRGSGTARRLGDLDLLAGHAPAIDAAAHHPIDAAMAVIGAAVAILAESAAELEITTTTVSRHI